jgi:uncharacterized protein
MSEPLGLAAGNFSNWLGDERDALKNDTETDVPCGECTACCRSSYFIHIKPGETDTLSHIPDELLFPAPGMPAGNVLMGYDEKGHCPMLKNSACSIYEHRPSTCRSYDCRIFPATGIQINGKDKVLITQQVERWKFNLSETEEIKEHKAVQRAGSFLTYKSKLFPPDELPGNPTQLAIMAIKVFQVFLNEDAEGIDDGEMVKTIIKEREKFDTDETTQ